MPEAERQYPQVPRTEVHARDTTLESHPAGAAVMVTFVGTITDYTDPVGTREVMVTWETPEGPTVHNIRVPPSAVLRHPMIACTCDLMDLLSFGRHARHCLLSAVP
jgi:hypothetical protein